MCLQDCYMGYYSVWASRRSVVVKGLGVAAAQHEVSSARCFATRKRRAGHLTITPTPLSQAKVLLNAEKELALVVWLLLGWEYLWDGPPPPIAACRKARRPGHILLHNFHCFRATSQHSQNPHHGPSAPTSQIINPEPQKEKKTSPRNWRPLSVYCPRLEKQRLRFWLL